MFGSLFSSVFRPLTLFVNAFPSYQCPEHYCTFDCYKALGIFFCHLSSSHSFSLLNNLFRRDKICNFLWYAEKRMAAILLSLPLVLSEKHPGKFIIITFPCLSYEPMKFELGSTKRRPDVAFGNINVFHIRVKASIVTVLPGIFLFQYAQQRGCRFYSHNAGHFGRAPYFCCDSKIIRQYLALYLLLIYFQFVDFTAITPRSHGAFAHIPFHSKFIGLVCRLCFQL